MKWALAVMYVLLIPFAILFIRAKHRHGSDSPLTVALKAASTAVIVLAAVVGTAGAALPVYAVLITFGLVFGLAGDIVICQKVQAGLLVGCQRVQGGFLSGMLFFALGHLCYIGAFVHTSRHLLWALPVFVVIYLAFLALALRLSRQFGDMLVPTAVYGGIITAMLSLSVTMPASVPNGFLMPVAAVLFTVSDGLLAYNTFRSVGKTNADSFALHCYTVYHSMDGTALDWVSLCCYFAGQSLFAVSIFCLG